jgi:protein-tyrosine phosphatase
MVDLHCHVLPGIDDGPPTIDGSLAMVRAAEAAGMRTLVATPHVSARYPNRSETIAALVRELNERLAADGVAVDVRVGAEVAMTQLGEIEPAMLSGLALGDGEWLLIEPPFTRVVGALDLLLLDLQRRGHRVLLAHPERCAAFHKDPEMLASLVRNGVLTSLTAGSLVGRFGRDVRRFALRLVEEDLAHNVASDAHDVGARPPGIRAELEQAGLAALAEWFTEAVPTAILSGAEIPARPSITLPIAGHTRRLWRSRR